MKKINIKGIERVIAQSPSYNIYIGNSQDALYPSYDLSFPWQAHENIIQDTRFASMKQLLNVDRLVFARQMHGVNGLQVTRADVNTLHAFTHDADFLFTHERNIGIGVLTADCIPFIMYDTKNRVCAIVHAGWRGTMQGVVIVALEALQKNYTTKPQDLHIFVGPYARSCCFSCDEQHMEKLRSLLPLSWQDQVFIKRAHTWFFDFMRWNILQLKEVGIPDSALRMQYADCTICCPHYFSYRRQKEQAGRQMTIITLQ